MKHIRTLLRMAPAMAALALFIACNNPFAAPAGVAGGTGGGTGTVSVTIAGKQGRTVLPKARCFSTGMK